MEETMKLMESISTAESHTAQIEERVEKIDQELEDLREDLEKTKDVADALDNLDNSLSFVSKLLTVVNVIPSIGTSASVLKKSIDILNVPVGKASNAASAVEDISKSMREKIGTFETKVEKVDNFLLDTIESERKLIVILGSAQSCITSLPITDDSKDKLESKMELAASKINPIIQKLDSGQKEFIEKIQEVETKLDKAQDWLIRLDKVNDDVKSVMRKLNPMISRTYATGTVRSLIISILVLLMRFF